MLALNDKVRVVYQMDTGETDAHGNPITEAHDHTVAAAVWSLGSKDSTDGTFAVGRYRMILAHDVDFPTWPVPGMKIHWRNQSGLRAFTVDGAIDVVSARGRIHHYELTTRTVT